ncbi:MAG TPA: acetamidase/formamidase family protein, partial [Gemmatimonadaceae bacterium]
MSYARLSIFASLLVVGCTSTWTGAGSATQSVRPTNSAPAITSWPAPAPGRLYHLDPSPATVAWGWYDAAGKPILTLNSGDELDVGTVSTCSNTSLVRNGLDSTELEASVKAIYKARTDSQLKSGPGGHILTGPVFINGADSGDVLEVRIKRIDLSVPWSCNSFNNRSGFIPEDFPGTGRTKVVRLDSKTMMGHFAPGIEIPLHPFFGSMGVAPPAAMGKVNSAPPGIHAGNLDNKELVAGSTRGFLPEDFPNTNRTKVVRLDAKTMMGHFAPGIDIPLHPFFGSMGVAPPPAMGKVNSAPPGIHAGNLDNKELVAGSTLYIPVH